MQDDGTPRARLTPRRLLFAALALGGLALAATAVAAPGGVFGRHGHGFFGHGDSGWDPERVEAAVRHALRDADASDEQVAAVTAIVQSAADDLQGLHGQRDAVRDAWTAALVAGDRAALEAQRVETLATLDEASQRVVTALAEVAAVLTPEQRAILAESHEHGRHGWRHGHR